jgi:hypothetical protein
MINGDVVFYTHRHERSLGHREHSHGASRSLMRFNGTNTLNRDPALLLKTIINNEQPLCKGPLITTFSRVMPNPSRRSPKAAITIQHALPQIQGARRIQAHVL